MGEVFADFFGLNQSKFQWVIDAVRARCARTRARASRPSLPPHLPLFSTSRCTSVCLALVLVCCASYCVKLFVARCAARFCRQYWASSCDVAHWRFHRLSARNARRRRVRRAMRSALRGGARRKRRRQQLRRVTWSLAVSAVVVAAAAVVVAAAVIKQEKCVFMHEFFSHGLRSTRSQSPRTHTSATQQRELFSEMFMVSKG